MTNPATMSTFVRDPALIFLSLVGKLLGTPASRQNIASCTEKEMTVQLLECVLDMIEVPSLFLDVHLLLQSYELLYGVMGHDIAIDMIIRACDGTVGPHTKADRDLDTR